MVTVGQTILDRLPPDALRPWRTTNFRGGPVTLAAGPMVAGGAIAGAPGASAAVLAAGSVLAGRHVVVVGLGALGGSAAQHARAFGMRVTGVRHTAAPHPGCDTVVGMDGLDAVLDDAEFLFLAPPLTPGTKGLLSRERIARLPKGAGLVNIGRGGLVDQDAVMDALDAGHLGGAVLDVFVPEPVPPGHRLWTTPNLVMTPHVSADDPATYAAASLDIMLANLREIAAGRPPPNLFDPARGY